MYHVKLLFSEASATMREASSSAASVATGVSPDMLAPTSTAGTEVPDLPISIISISLPPGVTASLCTFTMDWFAWRSCSILRLTVAGSLYFSMALSETGAIRSDATRRTRPLIAGNLFSFIVEKVFREICYFTSIPNNSLYDCTI